MQREFHEYFSDKLGSGKMTFDLAGRTKKHLREPPTSLTHY